MGGGGHGQRAHHHRRRPVQGLRAVHHGVPKRLASHGDWTGLRPRATTRQVWSTRTATALAAPSVPSSALKWPSPSTGGCLPRPPSMSLEEGWMAERALGGQPGVRRSGDPGRLRGLLRLPHHPADGSARAHGAPHARARPRLPAGRERSGRDQHGLRRGLRRGARDDRRRPARASA